MSESDAAGMRKTTKTDVWTTWLWTREDLIRLLSQAIGEEIPSGARFYIDERSGSVYAGHNVTTVVPAGRHVPVPPSKER